MLKLLFDEHIAPSVPEGLHRSRPGIVAMSMQDWHNGFYLGKPDQLILEAAYTERLTLVTYDKRTIRPLLRGFDQLAKPHSGVIFVDSKTVMPGDARSLIRSIGKIADEMTTNDWIGVEYFVSK